MGLHPLPGEPAETADVEARELLEGGGREVEVPDGAARAAVDSLNGDRLALVWMIDTSDGRGRQDVSKKTHKSP